MPIKRCTLPNGQLGYKWGDQGHCYPSRASAVRQAQAAYSAGYKKSERGQGALDNPVLKGDVDGHPFRGNQHTDGEGSGSVPPVSEHKKLTVQDSARELGKRGYSMGKPRFDMKTMTSVYPVKGKDGSTVEVSGKEIEAFLKGKTKALKGDLPGHPFRGNQWTGGMGEGLSSGPFPAPGEPGSAQALLDENFNDEGLDVVLATLTEEEFREFAMVEQSNNELELAGETSTIRNSAEPGVEARTLGAFSDERQDVHVSIVKELLDDWKNKYLPKEGEQPHFYMLAGRGGSGKGNFSSPRGGEAQLFDKDKVLTIDPDKIKEMLIAHDNKERGLSRDLQQAKLYHEESSLIAKHMVTMAQERGMNFAYDRTLDKMPPKEFFDSMKDIGYKTHMAMVQFPPQEAAKSALERWRGGGPGKRGRLVPPEVIYDSMNNERNFDISRNFADTSVLYKREGSGKDFKLKKVS